MQKIMHWMLAAILICGSTAFTACTNEDNPVTPTDNLAEKIIGKWIFAERNGEATPTNKKRVFTFLSNTKAIVSAAHTMVTPEDTKWLDHIEADVAISDNTVTLTMHPDEHTTMVDEFNITAIDDAEFTAILKVTVTVDGTVESSTENNIILSKLDTDYSEDIIGLWRGYVTSEEGSEFDDGEEHQWEYKADGTYVYYIQDEDGNWIANPGQTLSVYFVDGTLLATRWVNGGIESREWWEIESIKGGVMKWKALRQKEDGTTYVATFAMLRVKEEFEQSDKQVIDLSKLTGDYKAQNGDILTGTNTRYKISITACATVTLANATIEGTNDYDYAGITCDGDATIILKDGTTNVVRGFYEDYPGIFIPEGQTLTIKGEKLGTGSLNASSNGYGAGIGGSDIRSCGNIVIQGGNITASGGNWSAGIGSGNGTTCGNITISGGTVTATGSGEAAGIGSGNGYGSCGDITISGGTVTATGSRCAAGIGGGGGDGTNCGNITISGGIVTATGGEYAAGIGSGGEGTDTRPQCGNITISGGTVTATGGGEAPGIGTGYRGICGDITITSKVTKVTATKGEDAHESIGAGFDGTCGTVTIEKGANVIRN